MCVRDIINIYIINFLHKALNFSLWRKKKKQPIIIKNEKQFKISIHSDTLMVFKMLFWIIDLIENFHVNRGEI